MLGHACHRAGVGPSTNVLILGAGPIGFVTMLAAHAFASPEVVIADISVERLKVTTELGADATVLVSTDLKQHISLHLISGQIIVKPLITTRFGFSESKVKDAFGTSAKGGRAIKVMFSFSACFHYVNACKVSIYLLY